MTSTYCLEQTSVNSYPSEMLTVLVFTQYIITSVSICDVSSLPWFLYNAIIDSIIPFKLLTHITLTLHKKRHYLISLLTLPTEPYPHCGVCSSHLI